MKNWFENNWIQMFITTFLGIFGVMTSFSFDKINFWLGLAGATIGTLIGAGFYEIRRAEDDPKTKYFWTPYVIGFLISVAFAAIVVKLV